jgi:hypothetical protein
MISSMFSIHIGDHRLNLNPRVNAADAPACRYGFRKVSACVRFFKDYLPLKVRIFDEIAIYQKKPANAARARVSACKAPSAPHR